MFLGIVYKVLGGKIVDKTFGRLQNEFYNIEFLPLKTSLMSQQSSPNSNYLRLAAHVVFFFCKLASCSGDCSKKGIRRLLTGLDVLLLFQRCAVFLFSLAGSLTAYFVI